jgi:hypothetical protein
VGLRYKETEEYHLYLTNLRRDDYRAPDIAYLYRARWEVELLFKELKSRFGLAEINTTDAYIIKVLIIMAAISLLMSRVIVDELRTLEAKQRKFEAATDANSGESGSRFPRCPCSLTVERHAHLILLYLMLELGYELPDLDELLLWASRNPNPQRTVTQIG